MRRLTENDRGIAEGLAKAFKRDIGRRPTRDEIFALLRDRTNWGKEKIAAAIKEFIRCQE